MRFPPKLTDAEIVKLRPAKNLVDAQRPYAYNAERELSARGIVEPVATIFLTNRECPFRCLMCDLWKNTLDQPTPADAILNQIDFALERLPPTNIIKLYNSGNFFDAKAVRIDELPGIAARLKDYATVIVENHPLLCDERCLQFRDLLHGELEIAMGLETVHPDILPRLNKNMTLDDFSRAAGFLRKNEIQVRSFVLLRPPGLSDAEGVEWAEKSVAYAVEQGVRCCPIVPTRGGNGAMEWLASSALFSPPTLTAIEMSLELCLHKGHEARIFMDLWDIQQFSDCQQCLNQRIDRLERMNFTQAIPDPVVCSCTAVEEL
jgi:radical SAM enzyme (TIGR01210 family)